MENFNKDADYQRAIHTLNVAIDKATEQRDEYKKQLDDAIRERNSERVSYNTNLNNYVQETNRLKRDLDNKGETISELRDSMQEIRQQTFRIPQMEREIRDLSDANRRHLITIQSKESTISKLQWEYNQMKKERDELEEQLNEAESEIEELKEGGELAEEESEPVYDEESLYEIPQLDKSLEDDQAILKLVKGGGLNVDDIEELAQTKNNINSTIDKAIDDALKAGNGRIKEDELIKMQGVEFDRSKITITAKVGNKILRRNFLSPTYSLLK